MTSPFNILFGDIHNHNAMGYGTGSLERSIDVARTHLDFFAFTGHSSWHDMEAMEGGREQHWLNGFQRLRDGWERWSQDLGPVVKMDRLVRKTIQNDETKEPFTRFQSQGCA